MHEGVDLNWFFQFIAFSLAAVFGFLYLLRKSASRYFLLDSNFDDPIPTTTMGAPRFLDSCAVCGLNTTKNCAACKVVKYCSGACQSSHWPEHKKECKDLASSYKASRANSTSLSRGRGALAVQRGQSSKILTDSKQILFPYEDFIKLFNWDSSGYPPCGLLNCGNSCFANAVLQCLAYTRPLVAYLLEKGHRIECNSEDWCFFCEFQTHIERTSQSVRPFSPINILSRLPNIGGNLGYGKQEDAHEFMRFAIDNMQSACLDKFGGEKAVHHSCQETTLIQHIFGGRLQSQVICTECNNVSNQFENMMDLTVEIHGDAESLEQCLDQFTAKEQLHGDNMYKCDGCNAYVMAWKRLLIQRAPNILTIALKRFQSGRFGKLNKKVSFPETLDLNAYMSGSEDGNDVYKLYAVIVHVDMLNASFFGHYICYVKDFRGSWYRIDDCKVENVELDEVLSQGAYMLMYNRISARPSCLLPYESLRKDENKMFRVEEIKFSGNQPAECSSASGHLESPVDSEQPFSASGLKINGEVEVSSMLDAQDEKWATSETNLVVKEVEIHDSAELSTAPKVVFPSAVEDVNGCSKRINGGGLYPESDEESHATENSILEESKDTCFSTVIESTNSKIGSSSQYSVDIRDTVDKSDMGSALNVEPAHFTELAQNTNLSNHTNGMERECISEQNLPVFMDVDLQEGEELSAAPEEASVSYTNGIVHTKTPLIGQTAMQPNFENVSNSSLSAADVASEGNRRGPAETLARIHESHAEENCMVEEDGSICTNVSSPVITDGGQIGDEEKTVNSSCVTRNFKSTAMRLDPESSSAKLRPIFSKGFLVNKPEADKNVTIEEDESMCNNVSSPVITAGPIRDEMNAVNSSHATTNMKSTAKRLDLENSAAQLKPIFSPGFLVKKPRKKIIKSRDEVPANCSELAPDNFSINKINEVQKPGLLCENGGWLNGAEKPYLVHTNGKASGDSNISWSVENGGSLNHNLDLR